MKNLRILIALICLLPIAQLTANNGNQFPTITGESLHHKTVRIPSATNGKYSVIGIASSKKSEQDLRTWMQPVYDLFINQNTFIPIDYNVNIYFIPMFSGVNKAAYNGVMKKTKKELDKELFPYVLFYKGSIDEYVTNLNIKDKNKPYFFVLDKKGEIIYTTSGAFTQKKLDQIESLVSK